ncbi:MAG: nuclear transport factor 2 family protein [Betaproteobacteria bacterium]|jgi:ketosteroid isomerase-like protein|nr:nuclear transport factor 2 family protein [Betaproteobacteria bacterium]
MSIEQEILALEEKRCAAMAANDVATLEKLFHDALIYTHSSAVVDTRASYLEALKSGHTRYHSVQRSDEKVRVCGDSALVTGRAIIDVTVKGEKKHLDTRFLDVWTKTPQGWKFVAWQSTKLPA